MNQFLFFIDRLSAWTGKAFSWCILILAFALLLITLWTGAIILETVFNWQGMGRLYYEAIAGTPDEMVIVALTFVYTLIYVVARMILEVLYVLLDPRVRYG